jgi:hypothetical protein
MTASLAKSAIEIASDRRPGLRGRGGVWIATAVEAERFRYQLDERSNV